MELSVTAGFDTHSRSCLEGGQVIRRLTISTVASNCRRIVPDRRSRCTTRTARPAKDPDLRRHRRDHCAGRGSEWLGGDIQGIGMITSLHCRSLISIAHRTRSGSYGSSKSQSDWTKAYQKLQGSAMILLRSVASILLVALFSTLAQAQDFPNRIVRLVVPYPAGGGVDGLARPLDDRLSKKWQQPVIVENKPGA